MASFTFENEVNVLRQAAGQQTLSILIKKTRYFPTRLPGAGKTQSLLWIRQFFEEICGWTHGVEFVFGASQNTMAALIGGFKLNSFHKLSFKHKDGTTVAAQK